MDFLDNDKPVLALVRSDLDKPVLGKRPCPRLVLRSDVVTNVDRLASGESVTFIDDVGDGTGSLLDFDGDGVSSSIDSIRIDGDEVFFLDMIKKLLKRKDEVS